MDLYRSQRTASLKQRMLLAAESLICEGPGCTTPADQCQVHHLTAWEHEGETNVRGMTMACAKHNGFNDDDPNAPPRNGRLERHPGGVVHIPPDGGPPPNTPSATCPPEGYSPSPDCPTAIMRSRDSRAASAMSLGTSTSSTPRARARMRAAGVIIFM